MKKKLKLWQKVIIGMVLGILFGIFGGEYAQDLKPFGDVFLNMIKMVVAKFRIAKRTSYKSQQRNIPIA